MKLTMPEILEKYKECDMFSLTGVASGYRITKEEFFKALKNKKEEDINRLKKVYSINNLSKKGYPDFDKLYLEIESECKKQNKIVKSSDPVLWQFYHDIGINLELTNEEEKHFSSTGKEPIEQVPQELREDLLHYEVSFYNVVTETSQLLINYYFSLNTKTKEYLLKFKNDFELEDLDDLALYKDNKVEFYSCTHEKYNSLEDYYSSNWEE
jgi:hypothetical protein